MTATPTLVSSDAASTAVRSLDLIVSGSRADFDAVIHPRAVNRESNIEPPRARVPGPAGFYATAQWLRAAFADLHYDVHQVIATGDLVAVSLTMSGRHVAPFVVYTDDGQVDAAYPPTHRTFAITQSHWFRIEDGQVVEHWANRDDLGQARQLGWVPPTPAYLIRMIRAKSQARRTG